MIYEFYCLWEEVGWTLLVSAWRLSQLCAQGHSWECREQHAVQEWKLSLPKAKCVLCSLSVSFNLNCTIFHLNADSQCFKNKIDFFTGGWMADIFKNNSSRKGSASMSVCVYMCMCTYMCGHFCKVKWLEKALGTLWTGMSFRLGSYVNPLCISPF